MRTLDSLIIDEALIDASATTLICHDPTLEPVSYTHLTLPTILLV